MRSFIVELRMRQIARPGRCGAAALALILSGPLTGLAHAQVKLASEQELLSAEEAALKRKLQPFIKCLNTVSGGLSNMARPYRAMYAAAAKDPANGPGKVFWTPQYEYSGGLLFRPGVVMACADGLALTATQPPSDETLDRLARTYEADLRKLDVLAPKVEAYYDQKDYRDDKMARGRTLNAEYEPLLQRLLAGSHQMFVEVEKHNTALEQRRVDAIERLEGRRLRWQANAFMLQARTSLDGLNAVVAGKNATKEAVLAQVAPLEERFAELTAYAAAHPEEDNDRMDLWRRISSYAPDLVTAAKEARRDMAETPNTSKLANDVARMRYTFNNIIDNANVAHR